jgi:hypothetical protein
MNGNFDGVNGLYGLLQVAAMAELDRQWSKRAKIDDGTGYEARAWLWQHKALFLAMGVLVAAGLLIAGGLSV